MKGRAALGVLLVVGMGLVFGPALAISMTCPEDEDGACCGAEGALCLCCSYVPRTALPFASGEPAAHPTGSLGADAPAVHPGPLPREVLHVPKPPPSH